MHECATESDSGEQVEPERQVAHPYWWCHQFGHPSWCQVVHRDNDVDRDCRSGWCRSVLLILPDAARSMTEGTDEPEWHPVRLAVSLRHRFRECLPRVVVTPDPAWSGTRYDFTRDEAHQFGMAALEAVMMIDGHSIPRAHGDQTELPYWWNHDLSHPRWCRRPHRDIDFGSDRDCLSLLDKTIRPILPEAARTEGQDGTVRVNTVAALHVSLQQRYREYAPRVMISPEDLADGSTYELTRDEAEQLGRALGEAVLVLDNQSAQRD